MTVPGASVRLESTSRGTLYFFAISTLRLWACDGVSKVSVVGAGMESNPGVAAMMFEALAEANINIQMIATSEIKISGRRCRARPPGR
mgnify:CR=1 FL=1